METRILFYPENIFPFAEFMHHPLESLSPSCIAVNECPAVRIIATILQDHETLIDAYSVKIWIAG